MAGKEEHVIRLSIVTPYKKFFENDVSSVVINTIDGQLGFMPGHPPLIVALRPGVSHFVMGNETKYFTLSEGYCEVSDDKIMILCNAAEFPDDLNPRRICRSYSESMASIKKAREIEDRTAREVLVGEYEQAIDRARARRHLIEQYGTVHQKERIADLVKEYGWTDTF